MPIANQSTLLQHSGAGEEFQNFPRSFGPDNLAGDVEDENPAERVNKVVHFALEVEHLARVTDPYTQEDVVAGLPRLVRHDQNLRHYAPIAELPQTNLSRLVSAPTFHAIQEWEGYVVDVGDAEFEARLIDLTADSVCEEEEAVIPLEEISEEDAERLRTGKIFRWVIGYERSTAGTKKRVSQIVFRDLPAITKTDLRDGQEWAQETIHSLGL